MIRHTFDSTKQSGSWQTVSDHDTFPQQISLTHMNLIIILRHTIRHHYIHTHSQ